MPPEDNLYYSEKKLGVEPRDQQEIADRFWTGFVELINSKIDNGSFAEDFPANCEDEPIPKGTADYRLRAVIGCEFPDMNPILDPYSKPDTLTVLDMIEFFFRIVSQVAQRSTVHNFYNHTHIVGFDRESGRKQFIDDINRMLRRGRHPYELNKQGKVTRIGPEILRDVLLTELRTGEDELDRLISVAIKKFFDPNLDTRKEALEKLWDAWERIKTLRDPDKREGWSKLKDSAISGKIFKEKIELEAGWLTSIGNEFLIRHTETNKTPIERSVDVDYLFHRLYALIRLLVEGQKP